MNRQNRVVGRVSALSLCILTRVCVCGCCVNQTEQTEQQRAAFQLELKKRKERDDLVQVRVCGNFRGGCSLILLSPLCVG